LVPVTVRAALLGKLVGAAGTSLPKTLFKLAIPSVREVVVVNCAAEVRYAALVGVPI
jgi:hypothetical protein